MRGKKEFFAHAKKKEKDLEREFETSEKLSGKDVFAMMLSAFFVFIPICVGILVAISLLVLWMFRAI